MAGSISNITQKFSEGSMKNSALKSLENNHSKQLRVRFKAQQPICLQTRHEFQTWGIFLLYLPSLTQDEPNLRIAQHVLKAQLSMVNLILTNGLVKLASDVYDFGEMSYFLYLSVFYFPSLFPSALIRVSHRHMAMKQEIKPWQKLLNQIPTPTTNG